LGDFSQTNMVVLYSTTCRIANAEGATIPLNLIRSSFVMAAQESMLRGETTQVHFRVKNFAFLMSNVKVQKTLKI
jgi:hypothetical protein